jgi:hypothetical protein
MPPESTNQSVSDQIAANARTWTGKDFKPGQSERCQDFVNTVLNTTSPGLADRIGTTSDAKDGLESGPLLASRFFGGDKSTLFNNASQARPGDIIAFTNTYGNYPPGTITHVGIYVGDGMMVDRSTMSEPVRMRSIDTFGAGNYTFARPHAIEQMQSQAPNNPAPQAPEPRQVQTQDSIVWPVPGRNALNRSDVPIEGDGAFNAVRSGGRQHSGIDIQGKIGDPVVSVKPGTVVYAGNSMDPNGYGNSVLVDHGGGSATFYAHLDSVSAKVGDQVKAGDQIGRLGVDGNARAVHAQGGDPHLHFEVLQNFNRNNLNSGTPIDPTKFLESARQGTDQTPVQGQPAPSQRSAPPTSNPSGLLFQDDTGPQVSQLQQRLNQLGFKDAQGRALAVDGDFGPNTLHAVRGLQRAAGVTVDGIVGPETYGAMSKLEAARTNGAPPQAPPQPGRPGAPSTQSGSTDFGAQLRSNDLSKTSIYLAIGLAEGTIGRDGRPTAAYGGHQDPGNNVLNKGFGSYQVHQDPRGASLTAQQADRIQADRLAGEWPKIDQALTRAGFQPGPTRDLIAANALDAWNQAPATQGGRHGLLNPQQLATLKQNIDAGQSPTSAITTWRAESYKEDNGVLNAPGLGNSMSRVLADQGRRVAAVNDGLQLRPPAPTVAVAAPAPSPSAPAAAAPAPAPSSPAAAPTQPVTLADQRHPDHAMFKQAEGLLSRLPNGTFKNPQELMNAAGSITYEAKFSGMSSVDNVSLNKSGSGFIVSQGSHNGSGDRILVSKDSAVVQSVQTSGQRIAQDMPEPQAIAQAPKTPEVATQAKPQIHA